MQHRADHEQANGAMNARKKERDSKAGRIFLEKIHGRGGEAVVRKERGKIARIYIYIPRP